MKKKFIPVIALASILTLGTVSATITSCDPTQEVVEVTAITLSLSKNSGKVGETITATVTINPTEASDQKYELISSDTTMASIEGNTITLLKAGTVTITAKSNSGNKTDSKTITIEDATVAVESVSLTLDKESIEVGQTATATVSVLPAAATNKNYTLSVDNTEKASIDSATGVITALAEGTVTITAKTEDGNKTDSKTLTITPKVADPVLTIAGDVTEINVNAGEEIALPAATAEDYDHTDLTSEIVVEDFDDNSSIKKAAGGYKFNSLIAGAHTISYYVESTTTRSAEKLITVNVVSATEETYELEGKTDPSALGTYGEYRENFAKGKNSPLYKGIKDSAHATKISATSDAISGNSMVIDFNKTAGNEANSVLLGSFSDAMLRNTKVTYIVEFDYKVIAGSDSSCRDIYFGARYDGFAGINTAFVASADGNTHHASFKFPEFVAPETVNAGFFFFKLSASTEDVVVAVDNFSFKANRCAETTSVKPTSEQLQTESGFTFNWSDKSASFQQGEVIIVDEIENEAIKNAIKAKTDSFGTNVMHLTGADNHSFSGLDATNLVSGMILTIDYDYYCVNDGAFLVLPMAGGVQAGTLEPGNGITITDVEGNIKHASISYKLASGVDQLNFYPNGNKNFSIYVGNFTCKLAAPAEEEVDRTATALGHHVGDSWTNTTRTFGNKDDASMSITNDFATPDTVSGEGIGDKVTKLVLKSGAGDVTAEWYRPERQQLEAGQKYTIDVVYYVESFDAGNQFMLRLDGIFENLDSTPGYHKKTVTITPTADVDFISFYYPQKASADEVVYVASTTVTLTKVNIGKTLLGYSRGQSWTNTSRTFGNKDDATISITNDFATPDTVNGEGIGDKVTKLVLKSGAGDVTAEWYRPERQQLEAGQKYTIDVVYYVESFDAGNQFMLRLDGIFENLDSSVGYHKFTVTVTPTADVDFISFYYPQKASADEVVYVASTTVTLVDINV